MSEAQFWILAGPLLFAAGGVLLVLLIAWRSRAGHKEPRGHKGVIEMDCSVCHHAMVFSPEELVTLSPVELALIVRTKPEIVRRKLAEYVCPFCEAGHCFAVDVRPPLWVGANFYQPQRIHTHCAECRRPLGSPPWDRGLYDHRVNEAPQLDASLGLVCSRCASICCLPCTKRYSAARSKTGELFCPRCSRQPMDTFYHP